MKWWEESWGREGKRILGGNSKGFRGKGGEEIADWTLRVSNYFYCPKSPFLAQSGLLGSSKKYSPCHSSPKEMSRSLSCCGVKTCLHVSSIIIQLCSIIPSTPAPTTAYGPSSHFVCEYALRCMFVFKSTWNSPRPICDHSFPLTAITVSVSACMYLFAQLVLCSLYWQHQSNPAAAVLPDSKPMCDEGPTLRWESNAVIGEQWPSSTSFLPIGWTRVHIHMHEQHGPNCSVDVLCMYVCVLKRPT